MSEEMRNTFSFSLCCCVFEREKKKNAEHLEMKEQEKKTSFYSCFYFVSRCFEAIESHFFRSIKKMRSESGSMRPCDTDKKCIKKILLNKLRVK